MYYVIEVCGKRVLGIQPFRDIGTAQDCFVDIAMENGCPESEVKQALENGFWEDDTDYGISFVWDE